MSWGLQKDMHCSWSMNENIHNPHLGQHFTVCRLSKTLDDHPPTTGSSRAQKDSKASTLASSSSSSRVSSSNQRAKPRKERLATGKSCEMDASAQDGNKASITELVEHKGASPSRPCEPSQGRMFCLGSVVQKGDTFDSCICS